MAAGNLCPEAKVVFEDIAQTVNVAHDWSPEF